VAATSTDVEGKNIMHCAQRRGIDTKNHQKMCILRFIQNSFTELFFLFVSLEL